MFLLKKLITPFMLPPGLFVSLLLLTAFWALRRKKHWTAVLAGGMGAAIWLLSVGPTADYLMGTLESGITVAADPQGDAIIMLGGGVHARAPDLSGTGAPSRNTLERLVTATRLHRRLDVPIILSGGAVHPTGVSSAILSKRFLIDLGVPAEQIIVETQSRDTYENALFSKQICERDGFRRPLLVTSGHHLKRAMFCFDAVGLPVTPFPSGLTTWPDKHYSWHAWLPDAGSLSTTAAALHEWLGLLYYRIAY